MSFWRSTGKVTAIAGIAVPVVGVFSRYFKYVTLRQALELVLRPPAYIGASIVMIFTAMGALEGYVMKRDGRMPRPGVPCRQCVKDSQWLGGCHKSSFRY